MSNKSYCPFCGEKVEAGHTFCPSCGNALTEETIMNQGMQNRTVSIGGNVQTKGTEALMGDYRFKLKNELIIYLICSAATIIGVVMENAPVGFIGFGLYLFLFLEGMYEMKERHELYLFNKAGADIETEGYKLAGFRVLATVLLMIISYLIMSMLY